MATAIEKEFVGVEHSESLPGQVALNFFNEWAVYGMPLNWVVCRIGEKKGGKNKGKIVTTGLKNYFQSLELALNFLKKELLTRSVGYREEFGEYSFDETIRQIGWLYDRVGAIERAIKIATSGFSEVEKKLKKHTFMSSVTDEEYAKVIKGKFKAKLPTVQDMQRVQTKSNGAIRKKRSVPRKRRLR